jgi:gamma-glutamyltranspeptidase/glutathione hydrolase
VQKDLAATLRKLVEAEQQALAAGRAARDAITRRTTASTRATSPTSCARHARAGRPLHDGRPRRLEARSSRSPCKTSYKGIDVYKLDGVDAGPAMLQALNILENADLKAMGYNSPATSTRSIRR